MGGSSSSQAFNYDKQLFNDSKAQSVAVEEGDSKFENCTRPFRATVAAQKLLSIPFEEENGGCKTVWDAFQRGVRKAEKNNFLGTREFSYDDAKKVKRGQYIWENYGDVDKAARDFGAGLAELGLKEKSNVGVFSINRAEWVISQMGMYSQNFCTVSLYATLGNNAVKFIIDHAELEVILLSKDNLKTLMTLLPQVSHEAKGDTPGTVKYLVQFDADSRYGNAHETLDEKDVEEAKAHGVRLLSFSEVKALGAKSGRFPKPPSANDLSFVMYTSGTTGDPKGVMLSHANVIAASASVPAIFPLHSTDVHISYLPLAHIFEVMVHVVMMSVGGSIGFFQGDARNLTNDLVVLEPTILPGVPRVFSKIYQKVFSSVEEKNCLVKWYFNKAYTYQCNQIRTGRPREPKYDDKVFLPLRTRVGLRRCRMIITGAAPCPAYIIEFLRVAIGCAVLQGYGMTESAAGIALTLPSDVNVGHVGPPLPCCEVKLEDIPEMKYMHTDERPRGEICVRGANVFLGYFKNPKATEETIIDGWLHTGDVGRLNPNGTISIIDRKKNIFKLAQGEYIAAEHIESVYGKSSIVGQIWVYGNSFKSVLMAVVVPSTDALVPWLQEKGWWPRPKDQTKPGTPEFAQDFHAVCTGDHKDEIKQYIMEQLATQNKALKGFEKVVDIIVESDIDAMGAGFTEANNCLTPTFKLKRPELLRRYISTLKQLYVKHNEPDLEGEKWPGEN